MRKPLRRMNEMTNIKPYDKDNPHELMLPYIKRI